VPPGGGARPAAVPARARLRAGGHRAGGLAAAGGVRQARHPEPGLQRAGDDAAGARALLLPGAAPGRVGGQARGAGGGRRLRLAGGYYDFAWQGTKVKPDYGAQWWVWPRHKDAPRDLVQTAGALNNHGYVVPSLDLVFVRLGDGTRFPKEFEGELVRRVLAAVS